MAFTTSRVEYKFAAFFSSTSILRLMLVGNEPDFFQAGYMYNGVGVRTARGTGTSGHVSRNVGALRPRRDDIRRLKELREHQGAPRDIDPAIIQHNALRRIEVELVQFRDQLEDDGISESEVESLVALKRAELRDIAATGSNDSKPSGAGMDSHSLQFELNRRNANLASALGVADRKTEPDHSDIRDQAESQAKAILEEVEVRNASPARSFSLSPKQRTRPRSESSDSSRSRSRIRRYYINHSCLLVEVYFRYVTLCC
jgi:hypothetical protein